MEEHMSNFNRASAQVDGVLNERGNTTKLFLSVGNQGGGKLVRVTIATSAGTSLALCVKSKDFKMGMLNFLKDLEANSSEE